MIFNSKKREEKKEARERDKRREQEAKEISDQISVAEEELKKKKTLLAKKIEAPEDEAKKRGLFHTFKNGISKTKKMLAGGLKDLSGDKAIDGDFMEDLEDQLLAADLGVSTTTRIVEIVEEKRAAKEIQTESQAIDIVKKTISTILDKGNIETPKAKTGPTVHLFVGVNGVGKTTSIGKIAAAYKKQGKKVLVAAGDTFRAAAIEQLAEWCKRSNVDLLAKAINSDPAATMFEAATKAVEGNYDLLLCDTSGRLHTKKNLMDELVKMRKVLKKVIPDAPHASILVLDANTGQNAIVQAKEFSALIGLDGLIVTKLDGTAKGGVIIGIVNEFEIPVYYVGVGEGIDDLQPFSAKLFAESLFA